MDSSLLVVLGAFAIGMLIFFIVGSKNKQNSPQRATIKKAKEKNKSIKCLFLELHRKL